LSREFNLRLEERVAERTRIARDLHDTLLQSFLGVLMKFSAVKYMLRDRPEAQKSLEVVIEQARKAITTLGEELAAHPTDNHSPAFRVQVEGTPRELAPTLRDEVYRIVSEAVRNAFRHSHAARIEVEIRYDPGQFRLRVRDDGKGIDQKVLAGGGRAGHYGLPGMHERARLVGGKLAVWSEPESGTEAELTIPASVAYAKSSVNRRWMSWGRSA
jgi:signal transduction histidine kinase